MSRSLAEISFRDPSLRPVQGETIYREMHTRPFGQPDVAKTRAALDTLCPT